MKSLYKVSLIRAGKSYKISDKTKKQLSHFPWKELIGMRNRLIHAYFDVDHDIIWKTVREYLPIFYKKLKEAIKSIDN